MAGSQVSSVQGFASSQITGPPLWHWPSPQMSPSVHKFPSLHGLSLLVNLQPMAGSQVSSVQGFASSQLTGVPLWHWPPPHTSPSVQALPSSQGLLLLV
jgi:hypothetical protein